MECFSSAVACSTVETEDSHSTMMSLVPPSSERLAVNDETLDDQDDVNVDFPSLKAAASVHEKKHSAPLPRKLWLPRLRTDSGGPQPSSADDQSQLDAATCSPETPESIPACSTFVVPVQSGLGVWKELRRKSSSSDSDVAIPQRQKVFVDRELERPVIAVSSSHSSKPLASMKLVLGDYINANQLPSDAVEQPCEFVPFFHCTLCGSLSHSCHECSRNLGEMFCE